MNDDNKKPKIDEKYLQSLSSIGLRESLRTMESLHAKIRIPSHFAHVHGLSDEGFLRSRRAELAASVPNNRPLTSTEVQRLLDSVELRLPFPKLKWEFRVASSWGLCTEIHYAIYAQLPERETREPIEITMSRQESYPSDMLVKRFVFHEVQRMVRYFMEHEADEAILIGNVRVFDPHDRRP
jgi:hypothetical protein